MSEEQTSPESSEEPVIVQRRSPIRRAGCIAAVILWFVILLVPCFLIVFAVQQQFTISTGSAPGQQIRVWLISEADQRGIGASSASVHQTAPDAICVETTVHFLLWTGHSDPLSYCDCYQRADADSPWTQTDSGDCSG